VPEGGEQLDEEIRKESQDVEEELAKLLKEKSKGYPEVKIDGDADAKDEAKEPGKEWDLASI